MMTPAHKDNRAGSIAESQRTGPRSIQNGQEEHEGKSGGFMANTLNRLKKKDREPSLSGQGEEGEDLSKRKSKTLLGKKILGGLG